MYIFDLEALKVHPQIAKGTLRSRFWLSLKVSKLLIIGARGLLGEGNLLEIIYWNFYLPPVCWISSISTLI